MVPGRFLVGIALALLVPAAGAEADYIDGSALQAAGLVKFWQLRLPLSPGQTIRDCYLVDDQIYAATHDGYVYAVHAPSGVIRWIRQVTTGGYRVRRPCHAGDRTIFVTPAAVVQYDRYTGQPLRKLALDFPAGSPPVSDGPRFYVGGIDQRLYCFYLDDDFPVWKVRVRGAIAGQPALLDGQLCFGSEDGSVYNCRTSDKALRWRAQTFGPITAAVVADPDGVYAASHDQSLYMFDRTLGGKRWRARFSGPLVEPPVIAGDVAFQYCAEDGLAAVNTGTVGVEKRIRWLLPDGRKVLTVAGQRAYVLARDENLLVVRLNDGEVLETIPAPGFVLGLPSPDDPALYLVARDGRVFCARQRGVAIVRAEELLAALRPPQPAEQAAGPATTEPAEKPPAEQDALASRQPGPPIGAKSKVSKQYTGQ